MNKNLRTTEKDCWEYFWKVREVSTEEVICIMEENNQFLFQSPGEKNFCNENLIKEGITEGAA